MMVNSQTVKALERRKNPPPLQPLNAIQARRDLMWGANCLLANGIVGKENQPSNHQSFS
jgi:hypothetical protein